MTVPAEPRALSPQPTTLPTAPTRTSSPAPGTWSGWTTSTGGSTPGSPSRARRGEGGRCPSCLPPAPGPQSFWGGEAASSHSGPPAGGDGGVFCPNAGGTGNKAWVRGGTPQLWLPVVNGHCYPALPPHKGPPNTVVWDGIYPRAPHARHLPAPYPLDRCVPSAGGAKMPFSQLLTAAPSPGESLGGQFLMDKSGEATREGSALLGALPGPWGPWPDRTSVRHQRLQRPLHPEQTVLGVMGQSLEGQRLRGRD